MADHDFEDTADALTSTATVETTLTLDGDDYPLQVEEIKEADLQQIEDQAADNPEAEAEAIKAAIREYLVEPGVDPEEMPMNKRQAVFWEMMSVWAGTDIQAEMAELQVDQGNPT